MGAEEFHWGIIRWEYWRGRECLADLFCLSSESLTEISESKVMSTKQNHKNGDGDKHLGALGHSQEKIGESPLISSDLHWSPLISSDLSACEEGQGWCAHMLIVISIVLIFLTFPLSLCCVIKVVQVSWTELLEFYELKIVVSGER